MATQSTKPLAIYYEHPDWFRPLFTALDARGVPHDRIDARGHWHDPAARAWPHRVVFNRLSPSAYLRGAGSAIPYTTQLLEHLEGHGVRIINGAAAWRTEISKTSQIALLERLGLPHPATRVVHDAAGALAAAGGLRFPVVVKPNVGGSGAGIRRFDTPDELTDALETLDFGLDRTALVQEFSPPAGSSIVRVEVLNGTFLYAIRIHTTGDTFDLCPADVCLGVDGRQLTRTACAADATTNDLRVESCSPPHDVIADVERITAAAGIEIGGVEYLIDERDGSRRYYDINALSNFVADAPSVIGFDPFERLADWLEAEVAAADAALEEVA
jgi:hypothetical protein